MDNTLTSSHERGEIIVWDLSEGWRLNRRIKSSSIGSALADFAISPDGNKVAVMSATIPLRLILMELSNMRQCWVAEISTDWILDYFNKTIRHELSVHREPLVPPTITLARCRIMWSPDGLSILFGLGFEFHPTSRRWSFKDGVGKLCEAANGRELTTLHWWPEDSDYLELSEDGRLICCKSNGEIRKADISAQTSGPIR